jgi:hypothetical protein
VGQALQHCNVHQQFALVKQALQHYFAYRAFALSKHSLQYYFLQMAAALAFQMLVVRKPARWPMGTSVVGHNTICKIMFCKSLYEKAIVGAHAILR